MPHTSSPNHATPAISRRLHSVTSAARYMDVSPWTIRDWVAAGVLRAVELPAHRPKEGAPDRRRPLRRILIDQPDLDHLIDTAKGRT